MGISRLAVTSPLQGLLAASLTSPLLWSSARPKHSSGTCRDVITDLWMSPAPRRSPSPSHRDIWTTTPCDQYGVQISQMSGTGPRCDTRLLLRIWISRPARPFAPRRVLARRSQLCSAGCSTSCAHDTPDTCAYLNVISVVKLGCVAAICDISSHLAPCNLGGVAEDSTQLCATDGQAVQAISHALGM